MKQVLESTSVLDADIYTPPWVIGLSWVQRHVRRIKRRRRPFRWLRGRQMVRHRRLYTLVVRPRSSAPPSEAWSCPVETQTEDRWTAVVGPRMNDCPSVVHIYCTFLPWTSHTTELVTPYVQALTKFIIIIIIISLSIHNVKRTCLQYETVENKIIKSSYKHIID